MCNVLIKWQTGTPKEFGRYLVTLKNGKICCDTFRFLFGGLGFGWVHYHNTIVAWCNFKEIKPYREKLVADKKKQFSKDEKVWFMYFNKIESGTIAEAKKENIEGIEVVYYGLKERDYMVLGEKLYRSKQELIDSL